MPRESGGAGAVAGDSGGQSGASIAGGATGAGGSSTSQAGAAGSVSGGGGAVAGTDSAGGGAGGGAQLGGSAGNATSGATAGGAAGASGASNAGAVALFDGNGLSQWRSRDGGIDAPWPATGEYFTVAPGAGDLATRDSFGDVQLHVEFWVPSTPASNDEQDRGNSGIYLQGRYEVQVLDSYDHMLDGKNDCGAIYELKDSDVNASLPPGTWQTYDIIFRAARWNGTQKTSNARISVTWNGQAAQTEVDVPAPTRLGDAEAPGDAPLRLQDHSHAVRYRNIWLKRL